MTQLFLQNGIRNKRNQHLQQTQQPQLTLQPQLIPQAMIQQLATQPPILLLIQLQTQLPEFWLNKVLIKYLPFMIPRIL